MKAWGFPIKAVIFDVDGTLLDTLPIYYKCNSLVLGEEYDVSFQPNVNGLAPNDEAKKILTHHHSTISEEDFIQQRANLLEKYLPDCKPSHGIPEIVNKLHEMNIPMAVATSSSRAAYESKISKNKELLSNIKASVCGDEVKRSKPDPEIFQIAAKKLGNFEPENCLVFEDAFYGIQAAHAAGFQSCFTTQNESSDIMKKFQKSNFYPTVILNDFSQFDFNFFIWES